MRFPRIIQALTSEPWLMTSEAHASILSFIKAKGVASLVDASVAIDPISAISNRLEDWLPPMRQQGIDANGIAILSITGPIAKGISKIEQSCGVADVNVISESIEQYLEDGAKGILFIFNTPGGTATGVPEVAQQIADIPIPTLAFSEDMSASAGYYLMAGADTIIITPSASVGSIGVYIPWIDKSVIWDNLGMKWSPIINEGADLKATGAGPSLSSEQLEYLQGHVDSLAENFQSFVAERRGITDEASVFRGQVFYGEQAKSLGLVDFVGNYATAYDTLLGDVDRRSTNG